MPLVPLRSETETGLVDSVWERFISTGEILPNSVRPEIVESWQRNRKAGVDPYAERSTWLLSGNLLEDLLARKESLINVARPFMNKLYSFVESSSFVVLLCDERGYLLEAVGTDEVLEGRHGLNLDRGALWTENEVGNNGVGTSLILKRPFQISGAEHYCKKHHPWTCSGAPIFDIHHKIIGVLEMSGPVERTHLHTLGMVVAAAEAIQQQLRVQDKNRELIRLNGCLNNIFVTMTDGAIVIDAQGNVMQVNPVAEKILGKTADKMMCSSLADSFDNYTPVLDLLNSGQEFTDLDAGIQRESGFTHCVVSGKPIRDDCGCVTGGVIFLNPITKIKKLINRYSGAHASFSFNDIIGRSHVLRKSIELGILAAGSDSNVLLSGESGTGKDMFAQAIHNESARRNGPFVAVNCGAIPRDLIGSELFGYVEGAFTGARKGGRPGKFELASGGTLFLDEIGDMPLEQQVALLRVLQDRTITRIGGDSTVPIDVRIICATNKNLRTEVALGNFREDLYYRLNVISIALPPLREHQEDISLLFETFFKEMCNKFGVTAPSLHPDVIAKLREYDWPGNVRELQNVVERMVNIASGQKKTGTIGPQHLPENILTPARPWETGPDIASQLKAGGRIADERKKIKELLAEKEREQIVSLLVRNNGNVTQVAKEMKISRASLYRKLKKLNL